MSEESREGRGGLGTVRNAVVLLELLAAGQGPKQLTELAERSGMSLPTVHRLLRSLVLADLVAQDPRSSRYGLGPELARLSHRYLARLPVLGALAPYLVQLRDSVQTTVEVQALIRDSIVVIDQVDGSESGSYRRSHSVLEPLAGAGGRLIAGHLNDEGWADLVVGAPAELADIAAASRHEWSEADWLYVPSSGPTTPGEVAVRLAAEEAQPPAALVALVPPGAALDVEALSGQLLRAAAAAARTVGHV